MDTKSLNSRQVHWAQKLSQYYLQIDYRQSKANAAADALSRFPQKSQDEEDELRAENGQIFHHFQNSLTNASLAKLSLSTSSSSSLSSHLHQVLIYGTYVLPQLQQFWESLQKKLAQERPYVVGGIRLRLYKLQTKDEQAWKTKVEQSEGWDNIDGILHY